MARAGSDQLGRRGEQLAAEHLASDGYLLLERNWRSADRGVPGELDLILQDGRTLVVCEVKTRTSAAFGTPAEAVSPEKLRRLRRLARVWLAQQPRHWPQVRFDVVCVLCPAGGPRSVEHLTGVG